MAGNSEKASHARGSADPPYRAFLSYSHADSGTARKLHRKLETYRLPHRLSVGAAGQAPARLGPIFRDREDFPAATDLTESIKRALDRSAALIVLCSPEARQSRWVAEEIRYFRGHYPDRPVLAALIAGEPEQAFPEPLLAGAEPLAADLRPAGDGPRLGFLKLVAGLADVPLDSLVQRDAQRRMRRVTAVTLVSLIALLVMSAMTFLAVQSRNEAERQRAEAEGLIEYMLTDLREDLRGVGRLDVMTDVNQRAMAYYEGQGDLARLPAESLERRARILHAMGEDDVGRGDLDSALARFREAHRATAELLDREPGHADRIFAHAQSEYWVGYIAYRNQDWPEAERRWQAYRTLADRLVASDSRNPEWLREAGYAAGNLCTLEMARSGAGRDALGHCEAALEWMERVSLLLPENAQATEDVINRLGWLADIHAGRGRPDQALRMHRRREELIDGLLERDPSNYDYREIWLTAQSALARFEPPAAARRRLAQAARVAERMRRFDPDNAVWSDRLARIEEARRELGQ